MWLENVHERGATHPLLIAEAKRVGEQVGWVYNSLECKEKSLIRSEESSWEPANIGPAEVSAVNLMAMRGGYLELDEGLDKYLMDSHGCPLTQVVENLLKTRIFAREGGLFETSRKHYSCFDQRRRERLCCSGSKSFRCLVQAQRKTAVLSKHPFYLIAKKLPHSIFRSKGAERSAIPNQLLRTTPIQQGLPDKINDIIVVMSYFAFQIQDI